MRRLVLLLGCLALGTGCVSGVRPVKQLETFDYMVGGSFTGPGIEADPELTAWFRFAPIDFFDVTLGATVTLPVFESVAYGALGELRLHIRASDKLRVVLAGGGELLRFRLTQRSNITIHRVTVAPLLVYEGAGVRPYVGPKLEFLSDMHAEGDGFSGEPGIRRNGDGVFFLGAQIGLEDDLDAVVLGGAVGGGLLMNGRDVNNLDGISMTASIYIGY